MNSFGNEIDFLVSKSNNWLCDVAKTSHNKTINRSPQSIKHIKKLPPTLNFLQQQINLRY